MTGPHVENVEPVQAEVPITGVNNLPVLRAKPFELTVSKSTQGLACTDTGNAKRLAACAEGRLCYCPTVGKWLAWNGSRWVWDEDGIAERFAKRIPRTIYSEATATEDDSRRNDLGRWARASGQRQRIIDMLRLAQSEPGIPIDINTLDASPLHLGVENGVIELWTGTLRPPRSEDFITKRANVSFDPLAQCPSWQAFLVEILPDSEVRAYFQRAIGYALSGNTSEQCLFVFHGRGANGKSVVINVLRQLFGDYATQTPPETLMTQRNQGGPRPDLVRLRGARLVAASESSEGAELDEALIKQLTGQDVITCRDLHKGYFEYLPQFKVVLVTNHLPLINGDDHAIWRRIHLVAFEVTIPEEKRDPHLTDRLVQELSGIFNWALEGFLDWQRQGLNPPKAIRDAVSYYRTDMDDFGEWLRDHCELHVGAYSSAQQLYDSYRVWCSETGYRPMSTKQFGLRLTGRGFAPVRSAKSRGYRGIRLLCSDGYDTCPPVTQNPSLFPFLGTHQKDG